MTKVTESLDRSMATIGDVEVNDLSDDGEVVDFVGLLWTAADECGYDFDGSPDG